jgi:SAM-dependent methyltransferase
MYDYYKGMGDTEICERDDGYFESSVGTKGYFAEYRDWPAHQKKGIRLARGRVLDVGCGPGRVALHLQQKGLDAVGVDISPLAIRICKECGIKKARCMSITQVNRRLGLFDTIAMYGNNFGLFGSFKRARWLLRRFRGMTGPDARIIAETLDPYTTKNPLHLRYHRVNRRRGRMAGQMRLRIRHLDLATPWFDYLFVSQDEMRRIAVGTGWKVAQVIESGGPIYIGVLEKER